MAGKASKGMWGSEISWFQRQGKTWTCLFLSVSRLKRVVRVRRVELEVGLWRRSVGIIYSAADRVAFRCLCPDYHNGAENLSETLKA